jgi:hypothetical protein
LGNVRAWLLVQQHGRAARACVFAAAANASGAPPLVSVAVALRSHSTVVRRGGEQRRVRWLPAAPSECWVSGADRRKRAQHGGGQPQTEGCLRCPAILRRSFSRAWTCCGISALRRSRREPSGAGGCRTRRAQCAQRLVRPIRVTPRARLFSLSPAARGEQTRALAACAVSASSSDTRRHGAWARRRVCLGPSGGRVRFLSTGRCALSCGAIPHSSRPGACALGAAQSRVRPIPGTTFSSFSKLLCQTSFCRVHSAVKDDPLGLPGGSKPESAHALKAGRDPYELARSIPNRVHVWSCWAAGAFHPTAGASPSVWRGISSGGSAIASLQRGAASGRSRINSRWSAAARGGGRWQRSRRSARGGGGRSSHNSVAAARSRAVNGAERPRARHSSSAGGRR